MKKYKPYDDNMKRVKDLITKLFEMDLDSVNRCYDIDTNTLTVKQMKILCNNISEVYTK